MNRSLAGGLLAAALAAAPAFASTKAATMHYLKALLLQHQGDYAQALKEYEAAAALDPQSDYILEATAELALETGQASKAQEFAQRLVEFDPKSPKARLLLGNVHLTQGDVPKAQEAFEGALKLDPKYSEAMFALGNLLNAQSPAAARRYFENYLAANPERAAEAHYQIALVDERLGDGAGAIGHLRAAVRLEPDFRQARYSLAHLYEVRRDTEAALGEYLDMLEREPDHAPLLVHIGELYTAKDDPAAAQGYFLRAQAAAPGNPAACLWLAILAEQRGDYAAAAGHLTESSSLKDEPELALRLSYYHTQANRLQEAVAVLEAARGKWPENNEISYFLALGYDDLKARDKARALLAEIVARTPDFRDARFRLAALYEKLDRVADMEREFRVLLDMRPNDASALNYLGYSLTDRGLKLTEAEGLIRRAVAADPRNAAYRDSLGWSHFKQGRHLEALAEIRAALDLTREDSTIWEHLGDVQNAMGDATTAWDSWKTGLAYEPGSEKLRAKVAAAEVSFSAEELGERLLAHLRRVHGGFSRYGSLCEVTGTVLGEPFAFNGLLTYRSGVDIRLELLGPLFVPVYRMSLSGDDVFAMDPLPLDGVPPETVRASVYQGLRALLDYFGGRALAGDGARYHRGWRTRWISAGDRQLFLEDGDLRLQGLKTGGEPPLRLSFDDFRAEHGHHLPAFLKLEGKGFTLSLKLTSPFAAYDGPVGVIPRTGGAP